MTARTKIKELTRSWYLYVLFSGLLTWLANGLGVISMVIAAVSTIVGLVITFAIGQALLKRNGLVRGVLLVLAGLTVVLGVLGAARLTIEFFSVWRFSLLWSALLTSICVAMNGHSLRVLLDRRVRAYFR